MRRTISGCSRYIFRQLFRKGPITLLAILIPAASVFCFAWLSVMEEKNQKSLDNIYESAEVRCAVIKKANTETKDPVRDLISSVLEEMIEDGMICDVNAEAVTRCSIAAGENEWSNLWMAGFMSAAGFQEIQSFGSPSFEWLDGYSADYFEKQYDDSPEGKAVLEVVISNSFSEISELNLGDYIDEISTEYGASCQKVRIIGILSGFYGEESVFVPEGWIESVTDDVVYYKNIFFSIPCDKNKEYESVTEAVRQRLLRSDATMLKELDLIVYDEELKTAIKPLEQTIQLLRIMKPILTAAIVLCQMGMTVLFLFLRKREIYIMRCLGTSEKRICFMVCSEYALTGFCGIITGTVLGIWAERTSRHAGNFLLFGFLLLAVSFVSAASALYGMKKME